METRQHEGFITGSPAPTADEKTWGMLAHLSALVTGIFGFSFLGPLIVMLTKGKESAWVEQHAKESLNFQISVTIVSWVTVITMFCLVGFLLVPVLLAALVLTIIAGIKANNGETYRYPASIRLVK
ncbi:DUF4870 domain-containing protein [Melittangium boletus]|uniref:Orotate phosphoribosyltransferase n=1 Tax=Melittangium boletus DSM 14713 TaxID=1294270 RepID=A0A250INC3_9BACT|nr:DUF4870 domain-containing protein [Melittangium boletus]ATB32691.1 hypothetical protein MEBOL_006180 [Melittangium boletus DSM 14713]